MADEIETKDIEWILCVDSPGWGGSERDLTRMLEMTCLHRVNVLCGPVLCPELNEFFQKRKISVFKHRVQNSWKNSFSGLWDARRWIKRFPRAAFLVWAHHCESHRWLQVTLALTRRTFVVIERAVPATKKEARNSRLRGLLKRFITRRARAVVVCGHSQLDNYESVFNVPRQKLLVVPNSRPVAAISSMVVALRNERQALRQRFALPEVPLVLCVARMDYAKDQATLIRAIGILNEKNSPVHLVLVGSGELETNLRRLADKLALGRVTFAGEQADTIPWLAAADVFAFPSLAEGLPGALVEAMAAGLPCVATEIPGNTELIRHEQTGLLVPTRAPNELGAALNRLLSDREFALRLGNHATKWVAQRYDVAIERERWRTLIADFQLATKVAAI